MRKTLILILLCLIYLKADCWGFYAHKKINELAVFTLPQEMFGFYKLNMNFISQHAPDPDSRRYAIAEEGSRHFLDADRYEKALPLDTIPRKWEDAVEKYTEDTLMQHGIVPWYLELMLRKLTWAFKNKDYYKIIKYSTDLGHYTGDLNVPLHTTANYNGQLSDQHGIHALWESRLPELFAFEYDFIIGKAEYIDSPNSVIWQHFEHSHSLVDSVLSIEKRITEKIGENKKYSFEKRGSQTVRVYSKRFCDAYHDAMNDMVEDQMRRAIKLLGSLWYTAWVDAGQPNLSNYKTEIKLNDEDLKEAEESYEKSKTGTIKGRPEPN